MSVTDTSIHRNALAPARADGLVASLAEFWHELTQMMFDPYRPERHYMRGPGPACARKQRRFD